MKELLRKMFTGWILREASWNGEQYTRNEVECTVEACGGDVIEGHLISLFDHWGNDIQGLAPHYGITLVRDENGKLTISEDVPPAPSVNHWWDQGAWQEPPEANEEEENSHD